MTSANYKEEIKTKWTGNTLEFYGYKFRIIERPNAYHIDVMRNGKWRAVGNYRLREWAMYYAPIHYLRKLGIINPE